MARNGPFLRTSLDAPFAGMAGMGHFQQSWTNPRMTDFGPYRNVVGSKVCTHGRNDSFFTTLRCGPESQHFSVTRPFRLASLVPKRCRSCRLQLHTFVVHSTPRPGSSKPRSSLLQCATACIAMSGCPDCAFHYKIDRQLPLPGFLHRQLSGRP